ncbi:MerR family transcriptional regulator [Desulfoluna sp.]|uniref:MerR family transcriptional regulator n=1 Tax=Desulfoluna sp. TaxID=2045199 RepID=UPI002607B823|nr:MerR family transcriptional regulator [Desulfoluna sp.]
MKISFTVGEMARFHNISRQALIHYDKIGLFTPRETDPRTGYRHYSLAQNEELHMIISLKTLGMKLSEIKAYKGVSSIAERISIFKEKEALAVRKMGEMKRTMNRLKIIVTAMEACDHIVPFGIEFKKVFPKHLISIPVSAPYGLFEMELAIKELLERTMNLPIDVAVHMLFWIDDTGGETLFSAVAMEVSGPIKGSIPFEGGEFACIHHKGHYETIHTSRRKLEAHLESLGLKRNGETIEKTLLDGMAVAKESDYLVEVLMPFC